MRSFICRLLFIRRCFTSILRFTQIVKLLFNFFNTKTRVKSILLNGIYKTIFITHHKCFYANFYCQIDLVDVYVNKDKFNVLKFILSSNILKSCDV